MDIRVCVPLTTSLPASPPAIIWPEELIPNAVGFSIMTGLSIAFLYHSTPKRGMDGGFNEKFPSILKCGSFIFGRLQSNLKKSFNFWTVLETKSFTPFSFSDTPVFRSSNFLRAPDLSASNPSIPFSFRESIFSVALCFNS